VRVPRPAKEPGKGAYWTIRELEKVEPLQLAFKTKHEEPPVFIFQKAEREEETATAFYNQFTPISPISPDGTAYYYSEPSSAHSPHMPELYYRGMENQMMDHYPQVYLPAFTSGEDGSPRLTHNPTSPQLMSVNDMYYGGFDPMLNYQTSMEHHGLGSFPAPIGAPRIVLSRDSSFLDDWTANNSIVSSTAKLTPFGMGLTAEPMDTNKGSDHMAIRPQTPDFNNHNSQYPLTTAPSTAVKAEP
jgi:hypothetical protein